MINVTLKKFYLGDPLYFLPHVEYNGDEHEAPYDPWLEFCSEVHMHGTEEPFFAKVNGVDMVVLSCDDRNEDGVHVATGFVCISESPPLFKSAKVLELEGGKVSLDENAIWLNDVLLFVA